MKKRIVSILCVIALLATMLSVGIMSATAADTATVSLSAVDDEGHAVTSVTAGDKFWLSFTLSDYANLVGEQNNKSVAVMTMFANVNASKFELVLKDDNTTANWTSPYEQLNTKGSLQTTVDPANNTMGFILESDNDAGRTFSVGKSELDANNGLLFKVQLAVKADAAEATESFSMKSVTGTSSTSIALITNPQDGTPSASLLSLACDSAEVEVGIVDSTSSSEDPSSSQVSSEPAPSNPTETVTTLLPNADRTLWTGDVEQIDNSVDGDLSGFLRVTDGTVNIYSIESANKYDFGKKVKVTASASMQSTNNPNGRMSVKVGDIEFLFLNHTEGRVDAAAGVASNGDYFKILVGGTEVVSEKYDCVNEGGGCYVFRNDVKLVATIDTEAKTIEYSYSTYRDAGATEYPHSGQCSYTNSISLDNVNVYAAVQNNWMASYDPAKHANVYISSLVVEKIGETVSSEESSTPSSEPEPEFLPAGKYPIAPSDTNWTGLVLPQPATNGDDYYHMIITRHENNFDTSVVHQLQPYGVLDNLNLTNGFKFTSFYAYGGYNKADTDEYLMEIGDIKVDFKPKAKTVTISNGQTILADAKAVTGVYFAEKDNATLGFPKDYDSGSQQYFDWAGTAYGFEIEYKDGTLTVTELNAKTGEAVGVIYSGAVTVDLSDTQAKISRCRGWMPTNIYNTVMEVYGDPSSSDPSSSDSSSSDPSSSDPSSSDPSSSDPSSSDPSSSDPSSSDPSGDEGADKDPVEIVVPAKGFVADYELGEQSLLVYSKPDLLVYPTSNSTAVTTSDELSGAYGHIATDGWAVLNGSEIVSAETRNAYDFGNQWQLTFSTCYKTENPVVNVYGKGNVVEERADNCSSLKVGDIEIKIYGGQNKHKFDSVYVYVYYNGGETPVELCKKEAFATVAEGAYPSYNLAISFKVMYKNGRLQVFYGKDNILLCEVTAEQFDALTSNASHIFNGVKPSFSMKYDYCTIAVESFSVKGGRDTVIFDDEEKGTVLTEAIIDKEFVVEEWTGDTDQKNKFIDPLTGQEYYSGIFDGKFNCPQPLTEAKIQSVDKYYMAGGFKASVYLMYSGSWNAYKGRNVTMEVGPAQLIVENSDYPTGEAPDEYRFKLVYDGTVLGTFKTDVVPDGVVGIVYDGETKKLSATYSDELIEFTPSDDSDPVTEFDISDKVTPTTFANEDIVLTQKGSFAIQRYMSDFSLWTSDCPPLDTPSSSDTESTGSTESTPSDNTPSDNTPSGNTPSGNTPGGNTPGGNTPGGNTPGGNTPGGNTPGGNTPGGNTPGSETVEYYYYLDPGTYGATTGDSSNVLAAVLVLVGASAVVAFAVISKRRKKDSK